MARPKKQKFAVIVKTRDTKRIIVTVENPNGQDSNRPIFLRVCEYYGLNPEDHCWESTQIMPHDFFFNEKIENLVCNS